MSEELKACRYRVEKTGYGFWPYCVRAGNGTRELFKGHHNQCMVVAAELEVAFEDGKFVADRAQLPSQGGEAVDVVAYRYTSSQRLGGKWHYQESFPKWDDRKVSELGQMDELMTVAQHQRILAAATHPADQVAEPDAELVACLKFARTTMAVVADNANLRGVEYRSLIAEIKRIDAKLASLEVNS